MFIRVNIFKFASKIDADAMNALAKYEMINTIPGIISIEVIKISDTSYVAMLKFKSAEDAKQSPYIDSLKKNPNLKIESYEGNRAYIVEKA